MSIPNDGIVRDLASTLLAINRAYQEVIQEKIDKVKKLLSVNLKQQVIFYLIK